MKKYIVLLFAGLIFFTSPSFAASKKLGSSDSDSHIARNKNETHLSGSSSYIGKSCKKHDDCGGLVCLKGKCTEDHECEESADCQKDPTKYGMKCSDFKCIPCETGDSSCAGQRCTELNGVPNGSGGCMCATDAFLYNGQCVKYCSLTHCNSGYTATFGGKCAATEGCCCIK